MEPLRARGCVMVLQVLAVVVTMLGTVRGITVADLLPFEDVGLESLPLPAGNDVERSRNVDFLYRGQQIQLVTVNTNGIFRLNLGGAGTVEVFSADVDTTAAGTVFSGLRNGDIGILQRYVIAAAAIDSRFAICFDRVFTGTWVSVGYFDQNDNPVNTFQGHIIYNTETTETMVMFLYPEDGIQWTTGDADGGINGLGGNPAEVGLTSPFGNLFIPESGTDAIVNIEALTNIGVPGVFVYRVDADFLEPDPSVGGVVLDCDGDIIVSNGTASGSGSGSAMSGSGFPEILVEFVFQNFTVSEADGNVTVTVRATGFPDAPFDTVDSVTVFLFTVDGSAEAGLDYMATMQQLVFTSDGDWDVIIPILDNSPVEVTEYFEVRLSTDSQFVELLNNNATVEIIDDDVLVLMLENPDTTFESNLTAQVCVSVVSGVLQSGLEVVVTLDTIPSNPEDVDDFGDGPFQLTFDSGGDTQCEPVPIRTDNLIEDDELFTIFITNITGPPPLVAVTVGNVVITIFDSTVGELVLGAVLPVLENAGSVEVCAFINLAQLERDVMATITTSPLDPFPASDPADYIGGVFDITFERPNVTQCISIPIISDNIFEEDELFRVSVSSDDRALVDGLFTSAPVIIIDNTPIPFNFIGIDPFVALEGGFATICVEVAEGILDRDVILTLNTFDILALNGVDYNASPVQLVFNSDTSQVCTDIELVDDLIVEEVENFLATLSSLDLEVVFVRDNITVFIVDATQFDLEFQPVDYTVPESAGPATVCVVQTSSPAVSFARDVSVSFTTTGNTATSSEDFSPLFDAPIDFPSTSCIDIGIIVDNISEGTEFFTVDVSSIDPAVVIGTNNVATVAIVDDGPAPIGIEFPTYNVGEGAGSVEVCVVALGMLTQDVQIFLLSQNGSAVSGTGGVVDDFQSVSESLTLMAGNFSRVCVNVIIEDDEVDEDTEEFTIGLANFNDQPEFRINTTVIIIDNDQVQIGFEPQVYNVSENVDSQVTVCASLDRPLQRDGVVVRFFTTDGSAQSGSDYSAFSQFVTFNSGDMVMCVNIGILDDSFDENTENFFVNLESPTGDFIFNSPATVNIFDDDVTLSLEEAVFTVTETDGSQLLNICVVANEVVNRDGVIAFVRSEEFVGSAMAGSDFVTVDEGLVFNTGDTSMCIDVTILGDLVVEDAESFFLTLTSSDADIGQSNAIIFINDDDQPEPPVFGFENPGPGGFVFGEGDGTGEVCVVLVSGVVSVTTIVTVTSGALGDTATADVDYTAVTETLLFEPGGLDRMCVDFSINEDEIGEDDEFFTCILTGPQPPPVIVRITIIDNDPVLFVFNPLAYFVDEGADVVAFVVADRLFENGPLFVTVTSQDGTAQSGDPDPDYNPINQVLAISSGSSAGVTVTANNDFMLETNEAFSLILTDGIGAVTSTASVTIRDVPPPVFGFENPGPGGFMFGEGDGTGEVCVVLVSGVVSMTTVVTVTSGALGDTATADVDYIAVTETLLFEPGGLDRMCVDFSINEDEIGEDDEFFTCILTGPQPPPVTVRITIIDNDPVEFAFGQPTYFVDEGADVVAFVMANRLFENGPLFVTVTSQDGTAQSGGPDPDYNPINQVLNIFSGSSTSVTVSTIADSLQEGDEQFFLILTDGTGTVLSSATVIIRDVDQGAQIGIELAVYTANEEDEAVRVCVSINQEFSGTISATISTFDQSAIAGSDYVFLSTTLVFTGDDLRECVEIDLIDDTEGEALEFFSVILVSNDLPVFRSQATVNIQDTDGQLLVTLIEPIMAVDEGKTLFPVCVDFIGSDLDRAVVVTLTTINTGSAQADIDYIVESTDITYFPAIVEVIICENVTIVNDVLEEEIETFGVTLTTFDSAASFLVSSGVIIIVDNDEMDLSAGFVQTEVRVLETDGLTSARLRAFVNGRILQPVTLQISIVGGTATVNDDYNSASGELVFNANSDNPLREFYTILGDTMGEPDETILFQLSSQTGGVALINGRSSATVIIVNDDVLPAEAGVIVLTDDTPEVNLEPEGQGVSVRVMFTRSPEVSSVTCALQELRPAQDCSLGAITFTGLPLDRAMPLWLEITAIGQSGQQIAFISRSVRLGFNGDCAVNFLNGVEEAQTFQDMVSVQFALIGPVTSTECQLDGNNNPFIPCTSPVQFSNLALGEHSVKVRPNGAGCVRRIRRTAEFTVV